MNGIGKAVAQVLATVLAALVPLLSAGSISPSELFSVVLIGVSAVGVGLVPNLNAGVAKYAKGAVAVATAILTLLVSFVADGSYAISGAEWAQIAIAALGALGVVGLKSPQYPAVYRIEPEVK
ncbi:hypothetical protein [Amycolatopsis japonica]